MEANGAQQDMAYSSHMKSPYENVAANQQSTRAESLQEYATRVGGNSNDFSFSVVIAGRAQCGHTALVLLPWAVRDNLNLRTLQLA